MGIQMLNTIGQNINSFSANQGLKKKLDEKLEEKKKIYNYIGMEVYDLYKAGKIVQPELDVYFEKMNILEQEIAAVKAEMDKAKTPLQENHKCSCGNILSPGSKFCPKCGKPVESEFIICSCGGKVKRGMIFCPQCGQKMSELSVANAQQNYDGRGFSEINSAKAQRKECICGALIPVGQSICMECGRKVTD